MNIVTYIVAGLVAASIVVLRNAPSYSRFKTSVAKLCSLPEEQSKIDFDLVRGLFSDTSGLEAAAKDVLHELLESHDRGLLHIHDVGQSVHSVRASIGEIASKARALAGIVIIAGLLVTLFNLRVSVGHLQGVFENMKASVAQNSASNGTAPATEESGEGDALQSAMAGIANSAAAAFGFSALFISFACGLLLGASLWTTWTTRCVRQFESAVRAIYFCIVPPQKDDFQLIGDLTQAVQNLQQLSDTFRETNTTLLQIGGFGDRFERAAKEISDAVAKLPAGMRESVSDMSGKLARDIAAEMEHYVEHIKHIEAIYGDQQTLLTSIVTAMSNMEEDWRRSSEALVELRALPSSIAQFKIATDQYLSGATSLQSSVVQLNTKVDALPVNDLANAAREMREVATNLAPLVSGVQNVSSRMKELIVGIVESSQDEARQSLLATLADLESRLQNLFKSGLQALTDEQKVALTTVNAMAASINSEVRRIGAGQNLLDLAKKLQSLTEEMARVPKLPRIFAKAHSSVGVSQ